MKLINLDKENKYKSGIYCITNNINDKIYIGSTKCLHIRKRTHFQKLKINKHNNIKLQNFVNKYGIDSINFKVIEFVEIDNLVEKEQFYIGKYIDFENDFNICKIAGTPPTWNRKLKEIDIIKISELYNSGMNCCKLSELIYGNRKYRGYISSIVRGITYSEYKELFKYRKYSQIGRILSKETKKKISESHKKYSKKYSKEQLNFIKENINEISMKDMRKILKMSYLNLRKIILEFKNLNYGNNLS